MEHPIPDAYDPKVDKAPEDDNYQELFVTSTQEARTNDVLG